MYEIEKLENKIRTLKVRIAQLNNDNLTKQEQKIIDSHLKEIAMRENEIRRLKGTGNPKDD